VPKVVVLATVVGIGLVLAGCGRGTATPPVNRYTVSDATVCKAFNSAASPLLHSDSVYPTLAKLAADARDADIRRAGEALWDHKGEDGEAFHRIGAACVAQGLTPKDWPELI